MTDTKQLADERDDTLTMAMDNVLASRLGHAHHMAAKTSAGDSIDRGLGLCRALEEQGFGIVKLSRDHFFIGQHPKPRPTEARTGGDALREAIAKRVHEAMVWATEQPGPAKDWCGGNSFAEDKARRTADRIQSLSHHTPADDALHPATSDLVDRFAVALKEKLAASERKYGWTDEWAKDDWQERCQRSLAEHLAKGDPRDVAAFAAFMWHHGWSTAAPANSAGQLDAYDAGLLPAPGGASDDWWQDAIRAELARAHDFYATQVAAPADDARTPDDVVEAGCRAMLDHQFGEGAFAGSAEMIDNARPVVEAILSAALTASGDARERALRAIDELARDSHASGIRNGAVEWRNGLQVIASMVRRALLDTPAQKGGEA